MTDTPSTIAPNRGPQRSPAEHRGPLAHDGRAPEANAPHCARHWPDRASPSWLPTRQDQFDPPPFYGQKTAVPRFPRGPVSGLDIIHLSSHPELEGISEPIPSEVGHVLQLPPKTAAGTPLDR